MIFDDLFGDIFDFDGNGKTDFLEAYVALQPFIEQEEEAQNVPLDDDGLDDLDDLYDDDDGLDGVDDLDDLYGENSDDGD